MNVFENYVNYAGSKTNLVWTKPPPLFENYVNYAGSKTYRCNTRLLVLFENYVNYAGSKTDDDENDLYCGLRTM